MLSRFVRSRVASLSVPIASSGYRRKEQSFYFAGGVVGGALVFSYLTNDDKKWFAEETKSEPYVYKVVLTGGPCGGKSTAMSELSARLKSLGYEVFLVPEAATLLISGGVAVLNRTRQDLMDIEANLMK